MRSQRQGLVWRHLEQIGWRDHADSFQRPEHRDGAPAADEPRPYYGQ